MNCIFDIRRIGMIEIGKIVRIPEFSHLLKRSSLRNAASFNCFHSVMNLNHAKMALIGI